MSRFIHLFISWSITFLPRSLVFTLCHRRQPYVGSAAMHQEPPGVGHQTDLSKKSRTTINFFKGNRSSSPSNKLVQIQPTTRSTYSTLMEERIRVLILLTKATLYHLSKVCITCTLNKRASLRKKRGRGNKRKKKTIVITSSPYKSELEIEEKERTIKLQEREKKMKKRLLRNAS